MGGEECLSQTRTVKATVVTTAGSAKAQRTLQTNALATSATGVPLERSALFMGIPNPSSASTDHSHLKSKPRQAYLFWKYRICLSV